MIKLNDIIKELEFGSQKQFDTYADKHSLRPSTKVTIAGKKTTAGKASNKSVDSKDTTKSNKIIGSETKVETFTEFAKKRLDGATKIANDAKEKGGVAILTYHHFVVKLPIYKMASEGSFSIEEAKEKLQKYADEFCGGKVQMDQIGFQRLVGLIEVYGELVIKYEGRLNEAKPKMVANINAFQAAKVLDKSGKEIAYIADTPNSIAAFIQKYPKANTIQLKIPMYSQKAGKMIKIIKKGTKEWKELEDRSLSPDQKKSMEKNWQIV